MQERGNIINGKYFADKILLKLEQEIKIIKGKYNIVPVLAIILVGDNEASRIYVRNKLRVAKKIGMKAILIHLPKETHINDLLYEVNKLNNDNNISAIIIQLPLPAQLDKNIILSSINSEKDVDGFHTVNVGSLHSGIMNGFISCTALGCLELIKQVEPNLTGKNTVIVGRSNIVGKPLSALLLNEDCSVTICHSKTQNLSSITSRADIVISAIGVPLILTEEYFNNNAIVIDVGITRIPNLNKIVGDVDFARVINKVRYITPVPGGVGPMTITFLLYNTFIAMLKQHSLSIDTIKYEFLPKF